MNAVNRNSSVESVMNSVVSNVRIMHCSNHMEMDGVST